MGTLSNDMVNRVVRIAQSHISG